MQVYILSTTLLICFAHRPFRQILQVLVCMGSSNSIAKNNMEDQTTTLGTAAQLSPPSRKGEPKSQDWDTETINEHIETIREKTSMSLPCSEMPSMPLPAKINGTLESRRN